jgi:hypothetical protein
MQHSLQRIDFCSLARRKLVVNIYVMIVIFISTHYYFIIVLLLLLLYRIANALIISHMIYYRPLGLHGLLWLASLLTFLRLLLLLLLLLFTFNSIKLKFLSCSLFVILLFHA